MVVEKKELGHLIRVALVVETMFRSLFNLYLFWHCMDYECENNKIHGLWIKITYYYADLAHELVMNTRTLVLCMS